MNVPKLRFKADDGSEFPEWEEKKLRNLFPYIRNGFVGVVTDYFCSRDEGVEYIEGTNIHDGHIDDVIDLYVTHEFDERHINSRLKKDDIVMVQSGHVGECAVVGSHHENANCHALIVMSNGGHVVSEFYVAYFYSGSGKNVISFIQTGNTVKHILASEMKKIIVPYPSLPEQKKIASFLSTIDEIIQSTESELTAWQERKKGVMQKIFNREVRFKADDGSEFPEWEEKRLDEVVEFLDGLRKPLEAGERVAGPYPYYGASGIIDYVENYIFDDELILLSEDGANIIDRNYRVAFLAKGKYWVNNHAHVLKAVDSNVNYFICEQLESFDYRKYNSGGAQPKLNQATCRSIIMRMPCVEEQKKIADCLSSLDDVINQIDAELSAWKEFKKGLLQQMFV